VYLYPNSSCCSDIPIAGKSQINPKEIVITWFLMPASSKLLIYFPLKNSGDTISGIHGLEPAIPPLKINKWVSYTYPVVRKKLRIKYKLSKGE